MKAYLNNGITIEGTVAEIKEFLEGQNYTITTTPNTTPIWIYPSQPLDPKYNKFEIDIFCFLIKKLIGGLLSE